MKLSVVIPVYNEEGNIPELYARLTRALERYPAREIVFVDDGSEDDSPRLLRELARSDQTVKVLLLSRNFKQHACIAAGLKATSGDVVVLMDGDLQDVPEEIPKLVDKLLEGFDLVYGVRTERNDPVFKRIGAAFVFGVFKKMSGQRIPPGASTFRAMSRRFVAAFNGLPERNRFTAGIMSWMGFSVGSIPILHAPRGKGGSRYDVSGYVRLFLDGIFSFSDVPLKIVGWIGTLLALPALVAGICLSFGALAFGWKPGPNVALVVSMFFLSGLHLACLAVLGQYVSRIFREVQERPLFLVKEALNF